MIISEITANELQDLMVLVYVTEISRDLLIHHYSTESMNCAKNKLHLRLKTEPVTAGE